MPLSQAEIHGAANNFVDALYGATPPQVSGATVGLATISTPLWIVICATSPTRSRHHVIAAGTDLDQIPDLDEFAPMDAE